MMVEWIKFIDALGKKESSVEFTDLSQSIGESPYISSDPDDYNDSVGKTKYFKFYQSGIEVGFRKKILSHIHFYFYKEEGYSPFLGFLEQGIKGKISKKEVIQKLGRPSVSSEGKIDILIGYINEWLKYEQKKYVLHLQFNKNDVLCRATLTK